MTRIIKRSDRDVAGTGGAWLRGLALAGVITAISGACVRPPDSQQGRTAQEIEQLAAVTDNTIQVLRSVSASESARSEMPAAVEPLVASIRAASDQIRRHAAEIRVDTPTRTSADNHLDARAYRAVAACARSSVIELQDIERHVARFNEASLKENQATIETQRSALSDGAYKAIYCALLATENLRGASGLNAVEHIGMHAGEVFAIATAFHVAAGLDVEPLLKRHIAANESIVARLAPECERRRRLASDAIVTHPCVSHRVASDALPKLKATLARVTMQRKPQSIQPAKAVNEIAQLTEITNSTVSLLKTVSTGGSSLEAHEAVRQIADAIAASDTALLRQAAEVRHDNPVDALLAYARARACVESWVVMFASVPTSLQRLEEAMRTGNDEAIKERRGAFGVPSMDASQCYFQATGYFGAFRDRDAVNSLGIVIGEIYGITAALRALAGLQHGAELVLRHHIEANEAIVSRLADTCEEQGLSEIDSPKVTARHPCASHWVAADALPKLRSALADLEKHAAGQPPPPSSCSAVRDEVKQMCEQALSTFTKLKPLTPPE